MTAPETTAVTRTQSLAGSWQLRALAGPVPEALGQDAVAATVPGCVHTDLRAAGLIDDPFDGANEADQHWIGETDWQYETTFEFAGTVDGVRYELVAESLDTFATVLLNGAVVGEAANQFRAHRFDIADRLRTGTNTVTVRFAAPVARARALARRHGERPHVNRHPYNAVRKMASSFGWDWGIDTATSGISGPLRIESWTGVRIAGVRPLVDVVGTTGVVDAHVDLDWSAGAADTEMVLEVDGHRASVPVRAGQPQARVRVDVPRARLWWPRGHGEQPLSSVSVRSGDDLWSGRVGFRTVELDTAPDADGTPFRMRVNGRIILIRGANWIPDHAFLTEIDGARIRRRIADATDANMNLLRVWGGGVYESDEFYDICDENGVLVWQDFLFACAAYAEEPWLAAEVEQEARAAVTRLSPHPSLVVWNGNNENVWGHVEWGWREPLAGRSWGAGYYFDLLPRILRELDPTRPYSPASPYSFTDGVHPNDENHGTMHIWDVWNTRDYTGYADYRPRFVSEFGFQGPPAWTTLVESVHDEPLDPFGAQLLVHQKAADGNAKLVRGMRGHLPEPRDFDDWHWATQLNQAAAVRFGIEHFRSLTPHNTGAIVWQLNDDWPVVSWAAVDHAERRKPLWFALRDAFRPRALLLPDSRVATFVNDVDEPWRGEVQFSRVGLAGEVYGQSTVEVSVEARGVTRLEVPGEVSGSDRSGYEVLVAQPLPAPEAGGARVGRAVHHFAEVVDQALDPQALSVRAETLGNGHYLVHLHAQSLVRDAMLLVDRADASFVVDDGMMTLLAGETATVRVRGRDGVDPARLAHRSVARSANDLRRHP